MNSFRRRNSGKEYLRIPHSFFCSLFDMFQLNLEMLQTWVFSSIDVQVQGTGMGRVLFSQPVTSGFVFRALCLASFVSFFHYMPSANVLIVN